MDDLRSADAPDLQLEGFENEPSDQGLSLEDLSESFARLLGQGDDPYKSRGESAVAATVEDVLVSSESDKEWPVTPKGIIEAILFVGHPESEPISARHIASLMRGVRSAEVVALIDELNEEYQRSSSAYRIESIDNGFRLVLREHLDQVRQAFAGKVREAKLSQAAIDVLAVVAFRQPIAKKSLAEFLGDSAGRIAGQLIRRGLLQMEWIETEPDEASNQPSRQHCYLTTERFLKLFGLESLRDLPTPQDLERL